MGGGWGAPCARDQHLSSDSERGVTTTRAPAAAATHGDVPATLIHAPAAAHGWGPMQQLLPRAVPPGPRKRRGRTPVHSDLGQQGLHGSRQLPHHLALHRVVTAENQFVPSAGYTWP